MPSEFNYFEWCHQIARLCKALVTATMAFISLRQTGLTAQTMDWIGNLSAAKSGKEPVAEFGADFNFEQTKGQG